MKNSYNNTQILFLCFHYITRSGIYTRIRGHSRSQFKEYLLFLKKEFPPISWNTFVAARERNEPLPTKCSMLFFDDGLKEHADIIAPILEDYDIKAVFSIPTCILDNKLTHVQIIHFIAARFGVDVFCDLIKKYIGEIDVSWRDRIRSINFPNYRYKEYLTIKHIVLKLLPNSIRSPLLEMLYERVLLKNDSEIFNKVHMNVEEIREIQSHGHTLSVHTHTHGPINTPEPETQDWKKEIIEPRIRLSELSDAPINTFAYPYGANEKDIDLPTWTRALTDAGYKYAFNGYRELSSDPTFNPMWIERYCAQSKDDPKVISPNAYIYSLTNY